MIDALDLSSTRPADRPLPRVSSLRMLPSEPRHALPQGPPTQRCTRLPRRLAGLSDTRANLVEQRARQVGVNLPEDLELVHAISTDDAYGIEAYWHKRFADKRRGGEWFELTGDDVRAFKRRKGFM